MDWASSTITKYHEYYIDNNLITNMGVEQIMNQEWNELVSLKLCME